MPSQWRAWRLGALCCLGRWNPLAKDYHWTAGGHPCAKYAVDLSEQAQRITLLPNGGGSAFVEQDVPERKLNWHTNRQSSICKRGNWNLSKPRGI